MHPRRPTYQRSLCQPFEICRGTDLQAALNVPPLASRVARLRCFRGINDLTALTIAVELGDATRFPAARQIMGFTGVVRSEYSSGATQKHGAITKPAMRTSVGVGRRGVALKIVSDLLVCRDHLRRLRELAHRLMHKLLDRLFIPTCHR